MRPRARPRCWMMIGNRQINRDLQGRIMNTSTKTDMYKYLPISKDMEAVMKKHLSAKFSEAEADECWKSIL